MFGRALFSNNIDSYKRNTRVNIDVCGWSSARAVPATGKRLAEDIRNEIEIFGGKQSFAVFISPKKYEYLTIKEYFSGIYQDAHNIFIVQPKMGRRFESFRLCLWNPALITTQRRMSFPWFKSLAGLQPSIEDQVKELISEIRTLTIPYRESLASALVTLSDDAKEEDPDSLGISLGSLNNFYKFIQLHPNLKCPAITLTPDNNVYISWRGESRKVFSVHFLPDESVRFVLFKPSDKHPGQQVRISGTITADTLIDEVAKPHDVYDWIRDER